ncbi:hypothetical protein FRC12_001522 [Ceratobasidium sp. 428]|nr:hypothetical protein FRC12_001522 [Ceratobasidium sp. 428]
MMHLTRIQLPSRKVVYPFTLVASLFFLWGFAYGLLDVSRKHFQDILGLTKLESTLLQVAYFGLGYLCFSPVAGEVLKRKGYKVTILMGLAIFSVGTILFWPCAKFASQDNKKAVFAGFVICTGIFASGIASLEMAASSYVTCLPGANPSGAAFRLQLGQAVCGTAVLIGPFIASKWFFTGGHADNLSSVQWLYLSMSLLGVAAAIVFAISNLPETPESELEAAVQAAAQLAGITSKTNDSFFKQHRLLFGWLCQFLYVGSQVNAYSFFINYGVEVVGWSNAKSSTFFSYSLIVFLFGRFVALVFLVFFPVELMVGLCGACCTVLVCCVISLRGMPGFICLMLLFFFMGPLIPGNFATATKDLGRHSRRGASLMISAVAGGAIFPPIQGAIADIYGTRISYAICIPSFVYTATQAGSCV